MNSLFKLSYYFSPFPSSNFHYSKLTLALCLAVLAIGIVLIIVRKKMKKAGQTKWMGKYGSTLIGLGIAALGLLFFRETGVPYLSMRLWWVIWLLWLLFSSFKAIRMQQKMKKFTPALNLSTKKEDPREKYLPKKKRK